MPESGTHLPGPAPALLEDGGPLSRPAPLRSPTEGGGAPDPLHHGADHQHPGPLPGAVDLHGKGPPGDHQSHEEAMSQTMQGRLIFDSCTSGVYIEEKVIKENLIKEEVRHF